MHAGTSDESPPLNYIDSGRFLSLHSLEEMAGASCAQVPTEIWSLILREMDLETVFDVRKVSKWLRNLVDSQEDVWRRIAHQWGLVRDIDSPLPISFPAHIDQPDMPALKSATGYYSEILSFKHMCFLHARLSRSWTTPKTFHKWCDSKAQQHATPWGALSTTSHKQFKNFLGTDRCGVLRFSEFDFRDDKSGPLYRQQHLDVLGFLSAGASSKCAGTTLKDGPRVKDFKHYRFDGIWAVRSDMEGAMGSPESFCVLQGCKIVDGGFELLASLRVTLHDGYLRMRDRSLVPPFLNGHTCIIVKGYYPGRAFDSRQQNVDSIFIWDFLLDQVKEVHVPIDGMPLHACYDASAQLLLLSREEVGVSAYSTAAQDSDVQGKSLVTSPLRHAQVFVGTIYPVDDGEGLKHHALRLDWRKTDTVCLGLEDIWRPSVDEFFKKRECGKPTEICSGRSLKYNSSAAFHGKMHIDDSTDTLVLTKHWGMILVRPFSKLHNRDRSCPLQVGLLHYHSTAKHDRGYFHWIGPSGGFAASKNGRLCHAMLLKDRSFNAQVHVFVIDLDAFRLLARRKASKDLFDNVRVFHLQQTRMSEIEPRLAVEPSMDQPQLEGPVSMKLYSLRSVYLDATTVYVQDSDHNLYYMDFGLAVATDTKSSAWTLEEDN
ncbi:F-box domain [Ceraceosorus bombacis]|uniref:F-box domain n=1 Tax=Ceraceosorus bombacis TaxID=401625 RepID=A0A0P1BGV4_9BASI|nr:F-box domain [Ceraceosorus bombacis]